MNLFQKYGIKEVADVVFYSITTIGDEEYYTPVLFLDTLKVSTREKTAQKVNAKGGYANKKLIAWNFGKEITLKLEDALFTPASMSMIWGGELNIKLSKYTSTIAKINTANKYGALNYSIKAYPSPAFTPEEWELIYQIATEIGLKFSDNKARIYWQKNYLKSTAEIEENRTLLRKLYFHRGWDDHSATAMPISVVQALLSKIDEIKKIGTVETSLHDVEVIDRMEKFIVTSTDGLTISSKQQKENLMRYYQNDTSGSYFIYYDPKTMLPLVHLNEDRVITGWNEENESFNVKMGTTLYKWSRTVKYKSGVQDGILGKTLVIDASTFPDTYKIVGETYIREQKTGKDQRYQFCINRAQVSSDTNITLQADGEPTTFSMSVEVLTPPNDIMVELKQFDVDDDTTHGGTRIIPQSGRYSYTPSDIEFKEIDFTNPEIF